MNILFMSITIVFIIAAAAMVLIILVQRPSGGGLAGAFGGAGAGGADSVFGGRVGDALTWATVATFVIYLGVAISLNLIEISPETAAAPQDPALTAPANEPVQPAQSDIPTRGTLPAAVDEFE